MPFPVSWPPRPQSSMASLRVCFEGTTTNNFEDNAYMFIDSPGANPFAPTPTIKAGDRDVVTSTRSPMGAGVADANPSKPTELPPRPAIHSAGIIILNRSDKDLHFSFDGTNVHGRVEAGKDVEMYGRHEAGIALRSATSNQATNFTVMAW